MSTPFQPFGDGAPLCIAYGLGVDSTAVLVGLHQRGIRPDVITFADTGGEWPETYAYLPVINAWLRSVGFPEVVVVRKDCSGHGRYDTLEGNCLANETLPGLAFGGKSCSIKWKAVVQDAYRKTLPFIKAAWAKGIRARVAIGYDAGPKDSKRSAIAEDTKYTYWYPLRDWGWDREECMRQIAAAGLPVPRKSACFFCPSLKPAELTELVEKHPDLADRIIAIEAAAKPKLTAIQGLWRNGCKGTRGAEARPGSMTVFIEALRAKRALPVLQTTPQACGGCEA